MCTMLAPLLREKFMEIESRKKLHGIRMLKEITTGWYFGVLFFNFVDYCVEKGYPQINLNVCIRNLKKVLNKTQSIFSGGVLKSKLIQIQNEKGLYIVFKTDIMFCERYY